MLPFILHISDFLVFIPEIMPKRLFYFPSSLFGPQSPDFTSFPALGPMPFGQVRWQILGGYFRFPPKFILAGETNINNKYGHILNHPTFHPTLLA